MCPPPNLCHGLPQAGRGGQSSHVHDLPSEPVASRDVPPVFDSRKWSGALFTFGHLQKRALNYITQDAPRLLGR